MEENTRLLLGALFYGVPAILIAAHPFVSAWFQRNALGNTDRKVAKDEVVVSVIALLGATLGFAINSWILATIVLVPCESYFVFSIRQKKEEERKALGLPPEKGREF